MPAPMRPHYLQSNLYRTRARFPVVCAGRGSGKTEIMRRKIIRYLSIDRPDVRAAGDIARYFYGLPTQVQAKRVAWDHLKSLLPLSWYETERTATSVGRTFYESERVIRTRFGTELHLVGLDTPQRIEGNQWCGGVLDECSDQRPRIFNLTVRPALTAFHGWCARIGVPKRFGIGAEEFKAACDMAASGIDADCEYYHWKSATVVTPEELARIKATLDIRDYREQYEATWESTSGVIFHAFSDANIDANITGPDYDDTNAFLIVGSDFNVNPMSWCLCKRVGNDELHVFDELSIRNTNTQETLKILHERYGHHKGFFQFFGDASSNARKTAAATTDYVQIANSPLFTRRTIHYLRSNPSHINRFASCNARFLSADGKVHVKVHPRCKRLIADLKHRSYKEHTREPNDSGDIGHMSDALGYIIYRIWPLRIVEEQDNPVVVHS